MSIALMLRKNGYHVQRSVMADGRLIFPGARVSSASVGSLAVPVKPHAFHGGETPLDGGAGGLWWMADGVLGAEVEAMSVAFPGFFLDEHEDGPPRWLGELNTGRKQFSVCVAHRRDHGLPFVFASGVLSRSVGRRRVRSPHLYDSGALCVAGTGDWDPVSDTAVTVVAWAAHWLACHVEWFFTGKWPVDEYSPAVA